MIFWLNKGVSVIVTAAVFHGCGQEVYVIVTSSERRRRCTHDRHDLNSSLARRTCWGGACFVFNGRTGSVDGSTTGSADRRTPPHTAGVDRKAAIGAGKSAPCPVRASSSAVGAGNTVLVLTASVSDTFARGRLQWARGGTASKPPTRFSNDELTCTVIMHMLNRCWSG